MTTQQKKEYLKILNKVKADIFNVNIEHTTYENGVCIILYNTFKKVKLKRLTWSIAYSKNRYFHYYFVPGNEELKEYNMNLNYWLGSEKLTYQENQEFRLMIMQLFIEIIKDIKD